MGSGLLNLFACFKAPNSTTANQPAEHGQHQQEEVIFSETEVLDETLGHSFCYLRSFARFISPTPTHSDRFLSLSPSTSLRFSPSHDPPVLRTRLDFPETAFKAISGASFSANSSTPNTVLQLDNNIYCDDPTDAGDFLSGATARGRGGILNGFESTLSFCALPLQPVPRGGEPSGAFFLSGPIERGVPFSAPLGRVLTLLRAS